MSRLTILFLTFRMLIPLLGQSPDVASVAEDMVSGQDEVSTESEHFDQMLLRYSEPLDLNIVSENELRALQLLSEEQISVFIQHRQLSGLILSVLELQGLPHFDVPTIRALLPFVNVQGSSFNNWKSLPKRIRRSSQAWFLYRSDGTLVNRINQSSLTGAEALLPGSSWSGSFRFLVSRPGDFRIAWNADRDRGERFLWSPDRRWYGFDFHSYHAQFIDKPGIKNLILGDYTASFGQGLVLGGGFGVGKGSDPVAAIRASSGFRPYSSLAESGFFRGTAATVPVTKNILLHIMWSRTANDGQERYDQDSNRYMQSPYTSGIHRSQSEELLRKTWSETNMAAALQVKSRLVEWGLVVNDQKFSLPLLPQDNLYNRFKFRGVENLVGSIFLNWRYRNWAGFTEMASSFPSQGKALITGLLASLAPSFDLSLLVRHYDPAFQSFHSTAFSENTTTSNEQGVFIGWKYRNGRKFQLSGYTDLFRSPYLKYRLYKPSEGQEYLIRFIRNFSRKNLLTLQYRYLLKERNAVNSESTFFETIPVRRQVLSVQFDYQLVPKLSGRTRVLTTQINSTEKTASGSMMIQDFFLDLGRFDLNFRYSIFTADDFEARLYSYERDVWLSYSFPFWYGYGSRVYALGKFQFSEKLSAWVKWSVVNYTDPSPSENGLDEQSGKLRADLRIQFKWNF